MKKVVTKKQLIGEEIDIGKGATILLEKATSPLIGFLRLQYLDDPDCLEGDIEFLFEFDGEGLSEVDYLRRF